MSGDDPILARRAWWAAMAGAGKRVGYLLLLVAIVAFFAGLVGGFPSWAVAVSITGLIGSCIMLPPAIIAGYAVKAAEREDRAAGRS